MTLNTDAYGACVGAHNGEDGAIMIAGTGSCGIYLKGFLHQGQPADWRIRRGTPYARRFR